MASDMGPPPKYIEAIEKMAEAAEGKPGIVTWRFPKSVMIIADIRDAKRMGLYDADDYGEQLIQDMILALQSVQGKNEWPTVFMVRMAMEWNKSKR